jgi:hypothetical protein
MFLSWLFLAVCALLVALGLPPLRRRVRPNKLYGVRSRETLADEVIWYEANERGGRHLVQLGGGLAAATLLANGLALGPEPARFLALTGLLLVGIITMAVADLRFARRRWRERHGDVRPPSPFGRGG